MPISVKASKTLAISSKNGYHSAGKAKQSTKKKSKIQKKSKSSLNSNIDQDQLKANFLKTKNSGTGAEFYGTSTKFLVEKSKKKGKN